MVERTLFTTQVPAIVQDPDTGGVTLGVRWFSDQPGQVVAIRFYKGGAQGGNAHTVCLYSAAGDVLATAVSSGETTSGWQRVNLAAPVPIATNTEYRAAVFWPAGRYAATNNFFSADYQNPPLHAYRSNNGVYTYAGSVAFPTSTWQASNYFVDPIIEIETASPPPVGFKTIGRGERPLRTPQFIRPAAPAVPPPTGRVFYVATTGNDANPGTQAQPWRNINTAVNGSKNLQPGDTVVVMPGTYSEQVWFSDGGDSSGYVTLRSQTKHAALIRPSGGYSAINVQASYVAVDGFDVVAIGGHGIDQSQQNQDHFKITNNLCHDCGGSGIGCAYGEFYLIENNICHGNAKTNDFHTSGISIYQARNTSGDTITSGFRNIVRSNVCYNNLEVTSVQPHADGNGIIIDDFNSTQNASFPPYTYPTLVENNLCFDNGSKGIQVAWSSFVTVRNNTCYYNNKDNLNPGTWRPELSNAICDHNIWANNIGVANPSLNPNNTAIGDNDVSGGNVNVSWHNNLTFNGTPGQASSRRDGFANASLTMDAPYNNQFGVNPLFVRPGIAPSSDFHLQPGSPGVDGGTTAFGQAETDLDGTARTVGLSVDIGCYERW